MSTTGEGRAPAKKLYYIVIGLGHHDDHRFRSTRLYTDEETDKYVDQIRALDISAWREPA